MRAAAACARLPVSKPAGSTALLWPPWPPLLLVPLLLLLLRPAAAAGAATVATAGSGHRCRRSAGASSRGGAAGHHARRAPQGLTNVLHDWGRWARRKTRGRRACGGRLYATTAGVRAIQCLDDAQQQRAANSALRCRPLRVGPHAARLAGAVSSAFAALPRPNALIKFSSRCCKWRSHAPARQKPRQGFCSVPRCFA